MKIEKIENPNLVKKDEHNDPSGEFTTAQGSEANATQVPENHPSKEDALETPPTQKIEKKEESHSFAESKDDEVLNPKKELDNVGEAIAKNEAEIARLTEMVSKDKEKIAKLYENLGVHPTETDIDSVTRLNSLLKKKEELEEQKKKAETVEDFNQLLEALSKLPPAELKIIIETGKDSSGNEIKGKSGKVNPDIAKKLGKLAGDGVKKITKAILDAMADMVKGFIKVFFKVEEPKEGQ